MTTKTITRLREDGLQLAKSRRTRFLLFCYKSLFQLSTHTKELKNPKHHLNSAQLDSNIQKLPQELQDEILHLALLDSLQPRQTIDWSSNIPIYRYNPDHQLEFWSLQELRQAASGINKHILIIDEHYRTPIALQIDRQTRRVMAKVFYQKTIFVLGSMSCDRSHWWSSVPKRYWKSVEVFDTADLWRFTRV